MNNPVKRFLAPETKITKHGKWYAVASLAVIALGLLVVLIWNFNFGLDFTKGYTIKINGIDSSLCEETKTVVSKELQDEIGQSAAKKAFFQREDSTGGRITLVVRYPKPKGDDLKVDDANARIVREIKNELEKIGIATEVESAKSIAPGTSTEQLMNVFIVIFLSIAGVIIFMRFVFGKFTSGVSAVIAFLHDVLIMASLAAIFRIQINFAFIMAAVAVMVYSLYSTLVLFSRIRDKEKEIEKTQTFEQMADSSIKENFWRSLIAAAVILVPAIILCIWGAAGSIRELVLPVIFGLAACVYSSMFITPVLYVRFENAKLAKAKLKNKNT